MLSLCGFQCVYTMKSGLGITDSLTSEYIERSLIRISNMTFQYCCIGFKNGRDSCLLQYDLIL